MLCPLCGVNNDSVFFEDKRRKYFRCPECNLTTADSESWPGPGEEQEIYSKHNNDPSDLGYRRFLSRVFNPLEKRLPFRAHGLDFGSGPGPTLSLMFTEAGFSMEIFDLYYANNPEVMSFSYDFITATEVFEHLYHPREEIERLLGLLKPGGVMGIMTKLAGDHKAFSTWHYKMDPTHVCFYSVQTFEWIARKYCLELEIIGSDVILLTN
ncbi:MAG: class I SAM-dependent methyltransferase [Bacteriovoracaceae bacterium]|nr:class I SAM-dependent methyltransferase [Bacteriovoracaceae bacterium]